MSSLTSLRPEPFKTRTYSLSNKYPFVDSVICFTSTFVLSFRTRSSKKFLSNVGSPPVIMAPSSGVMLLYIQFDLFIKFINSLTVIDSPTGSRAMLKHPLHLKLQPERVIQICGFGSDSDSVIKGTFLYPSLVSIITIYLFNINEK